MDENDQIALKVKMELLRQSPDLHAKRFQFDVPGILKRKFSQLEIETPSDLLAKWEKLVSGTAFGKKCKVELEWFLDIHTDFRPDLDTMQTKVESEIAASPQQVEPPVLTSYATALSNFLAIKKPRDAIIYQRRVRDNDLTHDELASVCTVTKQRVQQIEQNVFKNVFRSFLLGRPIKGLGMVPPSLSSALQNFQNILFQNAITSLGDYLKEWERVQGGEISKDLHPDCIAIARIVGCNLAEVNASGESHHYIIAPHISIDLFKKLFNALIDILQEEVVPIDLVTLIIASKKRLGKGLDNKLIQRIAETSSSLVECVDDKYSLKMRYLKSLPDMAVRILSSNGKAMHFRDIIRHINHELRLQKAETYDADRVPSFTYHPKLEPMGRTGQWVLSDWNMDTRGLKEKILDCFHYFNHPLTVREIFESESFRDSPYPERSILTILSMGLGRDYLQLEDGKYILSAWKNSYDVDEMGGSRYNRRDWHDKLKAILKDDRLTTREILERYEKKYNENIGMINISRRLKNSPSLGFDYSSAGYTWWWVREYQEPFRRTKSMEIIERAIEKMEKTESGFMKLSKLRDQICNELKLPAPTFYKAMDEADELVKEKGIDGDIVVRKIRNQNNSSAQFPGNPKQSSELIQAIQEGEGKRVEFKETLQWDVREGVKNVGLHTEIVKTIGAFMNSDGGLLLVGVSDDGRITGLERDYSTLSAEKNVQDKLLLALANIIENAFGKSLCTAVERCIVRVEGVDVCYISVPKSNEPVFAKEIRRGNAEPIRNAFFVRDENRTNLLQDPKEIWSYCKRRFN